MASIRAKLIRNISGFLVRRVDVANPDFEKMRGRWKYIAKLMPTARGVHVASDNINDRYAEWLTPDNARPEKLLLYWHGGGYVMGGCDMHRQFVSHVARAARIRTLLPEYRLAPEHKFPAAIEDAVGIYRALLDAGTKPRDIVFAGDSAGGGLAVATMLALRDAGVELPCAAVLLSPFLDATGGGESMSTRAQQDPWFRAADVAIVADYYCEPQQRSAALVSPVFADVQDLPPIYIQVGNDEILLSDSERFAALCAEAGVDVSLDVWPDMWHVFQMFVGKMPEAHAAIQKIADYIESRFSN